MTVQLFWGPTDEHRTSTESWKRAAGRAVGGRSQLTVDIFEIYNIDTLVI